MYSLDKLMIIFNPFLQNMLTQYSFTTTHYHSDCHYNFKQQTQFVPLGFPKKVEGALYQVFLLLFVPLSSSDYFVKLLILDCLICEISSSCNIYVYICLYIYIYINIYTHINYPNGIIHNSFYLAV